MLPLQKITVHLTSRQDLQYEHFRNVFVVHFSLSKDPARDPLAWTG